jgi:predicted DNA-binding transcriptional regulator YafY
VRGLFPGLSSEFLRSFLDSRVQAAFLVKGPHYEDVSEKIPTFQQLEHAINNRHLVGFEYHKTEASKAYDDLEPYKLVNDGGIWYLAAKDGNTLKAFTFSKIDRLRISEAVFQPDPTVAKTLLAEDGIWLNPRKTEVVLKVAKEAASYFRQRNLIPHQVVTKELSDGGLIVSGRVAHANQILPTVRQWIPSVRIISPEGLQTEMETVIQTYLAGH